MSKDKSRKTSADYAYTDEEQLGLAMDQDKLEIQEISNEKADAILEKHVELAIDPWSRQFADFADEHRGEKLFFSRVNERVAIIFSLRSKEGVWVSAGKEMQGKGRLSPPQMEYLAALAERRGLRG